MIALTQPGYRRDGLRAGIVHFGVGNFHRSHQAMYVDRLLALGDTEWAICGAGLLPGDLAMRDALRRQDLLYTLVERDADAIVDARRIGSIVDYLYAPDDPAALLGRLASPETRIVSMTITEGGYADATHAGPTVFSYLVDALAARREAGVPPFTVVSCDNIEGNGGVARAAVIAHAATRDEALAGWIGDNVAFPSSMVDRITPTTTAEDRDLVARLFGVDDARPVVAEPFAQWILEDRFTAGRPALERVGVQLVDDVVPYERMKLRILNGSHQALAYLGLLAGHEFVHEAIADPVIRRLVECYVTREAAPTVGDVPGIDLDTYRASVFHRFGNPAIADTLVRIATDGAERLRKFVVPVLVDRAERDEAAPLAALLIASFAAVCAAPRLRDAIPDPARDRLLEAVDRLRRDPATFLDDEGLFGPLAEWASFRRDVARAYADIESFGVLSAADRAIGDAVPPVR
jgi:mannitol 2-dehydrogenase